VPQLTKVTSDVISTNTISGLISAGFTSMNVASFVTQNINSGSANTLTLSANNTSALFINTNQNIGIGTTFANRLLTVAANNASGSATVGIRNSSSGTGAFTTLSMETSNVNTYLYSFGDNYTTSGRFIGGSGLIENTGTGGIGISALNSTIRMYTNNGTEAMRIDSSGNLGIGTSSPGNKFHVVGLGQFNVDANGTSTPLKLVNNSITGTVVAKLAFENLGTVKASINAAVYNADFLTFNTGSDTERMRIDSSGNIGIGTTSPGQKLDVVTSGGPSVIRNTSYRAEAGQAAVNLRFARGTVSSPTIVLNGDTIGVMDFYPYNGTNFNLQTVQIQAKVNGAVTSSSIPTDIVFGTDAAGEAYATNRERMRITSAGNVGIGTASPAARLDVHNVVSETPITNGVLRIVTTGSNPATGFGGGLLFAQQGSDGSFTNYASITGSRVNQAINNRVDLCFATGAPLESVALAERMRISTAGVISFLSTNTSGSFSTNTPRIYITPTGGSAYQWHTNASTDANYYMHRVTNTGSYFFFGYESAGVGSISTNGSGTTYGTTSDYRLKENVTPMTGALNVVQQLKPVNFKWKLNGSDGQGFIAHELQAIIPDAVTGEKDEIETYKDDEGNEQTRIKPQNVDTSFLVATLTAAIQELKAEFDEYKRTHP
jgi:hypothetical protein